MTSAIEIIATQEWETRRDAKSRLLCARARISDAANWTQNVHARRPDGKSIWFRHESATQWCAIGSLATESDVFDGVYYLALEALDAAAVQRGHVGIVPLNDATATAHQDVLATFDEAAELLDSSTGAAK